MINAKRKDTRTRRRQDAFSVGLVTSRAFRSSSEAVYNPMDTVLYQAFPEVNYQSKLKPGESQISKHLNFENRVILGRSFVIDQDSLFNP